MFPNPRSRAQSGIRSQIVSQQLLKKEPINQMFLNFEEKYSLIRNNALQKHTRIQGQIRGQMSRWF